MHPFSSTIEMQLNIASSISEDSETTAEIHSFMDVYGLETMHALP